MLFLAYSFITIRKIRRRNTMDMSTFRVQFADPLPVPDSSFYGINLEAEIKKLRSRLKGRYADPAERTADEQWLKDLESRNALEKQIKNLKTKTKPAKKTDDEGTPPYDVSADYDKAKLKKLEGEKERKPTVPELSAQELLMWQFFLPVLYSDSQRSEKKLSDFPHTLPYILREKWTEYKRSDSFKEFEIRESRPGVVPQRFALFGWRDTECWFIAQWSASRIQCLLTMEDVRMLCLAHLQELHRARSMRIWGINALIALGLLVLWLGTRPLHWIVHWTLIILGVCAGLALLAIFTTWQALDTGLSLEEEDDLFAYLISTP
jgi:hypothetical protein